MLDGCFSKIEYNLLFFQWIKLWVTVYNILSFSEELFESGSVQNEIGSSCVDTRVDCAGLVLDLGTQLTVKRTHAPGSCSDVTEVLESAPHIEQHVVLYVVRRLVKHVSTSTETTLASKSYIP